MQKILAVSSGGGHWEQLMSIKDSFEGHHVSYANTVPGLAERSGILNSSVIPDCNQDTKLANLRTAWSAFMLINRLRPDVVVSTGAAPGLFALIFGRIFGAKTVWIDSVANSEQLSLSGKLAGKFAHVWLTQWEHLSRPGGPYYAGCVL